MHRPSEEIHAARRSGVRQLLTEDHRASVSHSQVSVRSAAATACSLLLLLLVLSAMTSIGLARESWRVTRHIVNVARNVSVSPVHELSPRFALPTAFFRADQRRAAIQQVFPANY